MPYPPAQEIGLHNAKRLGEWVRATTLKDVPRNHSGKSSKVAICRLLGISSSSIGTNNRIRQIFQNLDSRLLDSKDAVRPDVDAAATCPTPAEFIRLLDSVDKLQSELARLQHLSDTGQWVPE